MSNQFTFSFGASSPTGLAPTFIVFKNLGGTAITAPGVTEIPSANGTYYTTYGPTNAIAFVLDGFTTVLGNSRYVYGNIDPVQNLDNIVGNTLYPMSVTGIAIGTSLTAYGASITAQGVSISAQGVSILAQGASIAFVVGSSSPLSVLVGGLSSGFGNSTVDPTTIFGYLKRLQEFNEGNSLFTKATSLWDVYSRGSSALLAEKTLNDSSGNVTKT